MHRKVPSPKTSPKEEKEPATKDYISIYWKCCHVFSRVSKNNTNTKYEGYCPKCRCYLEVPIGKGGTTKRSFIAQ